MKILILGSGKSYHATRWANALASQGIEVGFASVHVFERPFHDKVQLFQLSTRGYKGYFLDISRLRTVIKTWKPDILHAHYATGYGFMARISRFKKRIISIYGSDIYEFPYKSILHKKVLRFNLTNARRVLSTSENMANEYLSVYPDEERPTITPFGVDVDVFRPCSNKRDSDTFRIGIVKKLERKYGVDVLLNAVAKFRTMTNKKLDLNIVGAGTQEKALKTLSQDLKIEDITTFYGAVDNSKVPEFLMEQDVFVVPSRFESFGVAAVEAQACEIPTIVANVGGLPEVIKDRVTGLVIEKEDSRELADALLLISNDETLRKSLGRAGRERVMDFYNWDHNVAHMIRIYTRVNDEK